MNNRGLCVPYSLLIVSDCNYSIIDYALIIDHPTFCISRYQAKKSSADALTTLIILTASG